MRLFYRHTSLLVGRIASTMLPPRASSGEKQLTLKRGTYSSQYATFPLPKSGIPCFIQ